MTKTGPSAESSGTPAVAEDLAVPGLSGNLVQRLVDLIKQAEAALKNDYYVSSFEIDVGVALGVEATGKVTVTRKTTSQTTTPQTTTQTTTTTQLTPAQVIAQTTTAPTVVAA